MPPTKSSRATQKRSDQSLSSFHSHYSAAAQWGERWEQSLFPALTAPTRYAALLNSYVPAEDVQKTVQGTNGFPDEGLEEIVLSLNHPGNEQVLRPTLTCLCHKAASKKGATEKEVERQTKSQQQFPHPQWAEVVGTKSRLLTHWNMDAASVLASSVLDVRPGHDVLDLCAAPGGKSIAIAQSIWPCLYATASAGDQSTAIHENGCLHSNEVDPSRNKRLASNLKSYLPVSLFDTNAVKTLQLDGASKNAVHSFPLGETGYDRVLLDAPCSSERHIIHAYVKAVSSGQIAPEMMNWKSSHSRSLAKTQAALLMTALKAVKVGGKVVYATCSLATEENDGVVDKVLETLKNERRKQRRNARASQARTARADDQEDTVEDSIVENGSDDSDTDENSTTPTSQSLWRARIETGRQGGGSDENNDILDSMTERTRYGRIALPDHPSGGGWGPLYFCVIVKAPGQQRKLGRRVQDRS